MMGLFLIYILLIVMVLLSVAFITLLERKLLGYIQIRKGPNKVGFFGIFQPFADVIKLFCKEIMIVQLMNFYFYYISPVIMLMVMLLMWLLYPILIGGVDFVYGILFFMCCMSIGVYILLGSGWASNSKYALLGALRGMAQSISYEVSLAIILLSMVFLVMSYDFSFFFIFQNNYMFFFMMFPLGISWLVSSLAETNRSPFDFSEGESELVSGFNVEYSSGIFALLFMGEYGTIIFMSLMFSVMFFGNLYLYYYMMIFIILVFIWVRGALPRFRYDKLMYLVWKSILPVSLNYLLICIGMMMIM
uniref:NADH-ubiquinone oxidoreductase chain 1 n=1 Tax=Brachycybe lecontii TaxID=1176341 RepID=S4T1L8_BRALC|nr:NADH dehydrogenase subunit 1 [Brachycybe lecontii]AFR77048.1 NADH dehydrogenase subunit 1 [Brachycybe lecontii]